jgi:D-beta-D-heptose 7-phosphate kinase/D-beta-D-heptose 1-phosphate adenosyltransferase
MHIDPSQLIDAFSDMRVLVLGDAILDRYLEGEQLRFCREAPVPNVTVSRRQDTPGGAANTAANLSTLGARVEFLAVVGDDPEGHFLRSTLLDQQVGVDHLVVQGGRRTRAKHRVVSASQLMLGFDSGDTGPVDAGAQRALVRGLRELFPYADAVIASDYDYGTLTPDVIGQLAEQQQRAPRATVVDSRHRLPQFRSLHPTAVKPSYEELSELLSPALLEGFDSRASAVAAHADRLLELTGAQLVAATLDREGVLLLEPGRAPCRVFGRPVHAKNAVGAGDTFVAALALSLAAGASAGLAGELANAAAALVIARDGTSTCSATELRDCFSPQGKRARDLNELAQRMHAFREQGRRVVFTNGCFDILHRGHVTLLERAKALGDILVVAVNDDASIRRLKGPGRPINTLEDRIQVLAALGCVDHVIGFPEDTCVRLVEVLQPHIFVKGGDYTRETLPEAGAVEAAGGQVHVLPYVGDRSTTGLIQRIQHRQPDSPAAVGLG